MGQQPRKKVGEIGVRTYLVKNDGTLLRLEEAKVRACTVPDDEAKDSRCPELGKVEDAVEDQGFGFLFNLTDREIGKCFLGNCDRLGSYGIPSHGKSGNAVGQGFGKRVLIPVLKVLCQTSP